MAVFFIVVVLMIILSVAVLLWPLLRTPKPDSANRKAVNLAMAKQRLRELGREREIGTLGEEAYGQAKAELELTLAGDLDDSEDREAKTGGTWIAAVVLIAVPVAAGWIYFKLGSPMFLDGVPATAQSSQQPSGGPAMPGTIESMVAQLEQRMQEAPDDAEGQRLLIRTYMSQSRFGDAVNSLNSWGAREGGNPDLLVMLADATASQGGGRLIGAPEEMLHDALEIDPKHLQALWIMGYAQAQQNKPEEAIAYWQRMLPLVGTDPEARQRVTDTIAEARQRAGMAPAAEVAKSAAPAPAGAAGSGLQVEITLDPAIAAKVSPNDAVFVYAKTPSGPPMPLAVVKRSVSDLPMTITLDDSSAMIPNHTLSGQSSVTVGARVSLGGGPVAQVGDFYIELEGVSTSSGDVVKLAISKVK